MSLPLKIAWLGPVFSETEMLRRSAISPAGNRWQTGILSGLSSIGHRPTIVGFCPEPAWPKGPFLAQSVSELFDFADVTIKPYLNLPYVRHCSQFLTLKFLLTRELFSQVDVVLSYNAPPAVRLLARALVKAGVPWVPIVADVPTNPIDRRHHDGALSLAAGTVYLSHHLWKNAGGHKLHLDGGVSTTTTNDDVFLNAFLYAGLITDYTGVFDLISEFRKWKKPGVELWVCGKGNIEHAKHLAHGDTRIKILGPVSEASLRELSNQALAFINPRRVEDPLNSTNFPSKLLEYLSYGKPVVSTWTPGLSEEYREILIVCDSLSNICESLNFVLDWSRETRLAYRRKVFDFLRSTRLWEKQAERLVFWLQDVVDSVTARPELKGEPV